MSDDLINEEDLYWVAEIVGELFDEDKITRVECDSVQNALLPSTTE